MVKLKALGFLGYCLALCGIFYCDCEPMHENYHCYQYHCISNTEIVIVWLYHDHTRFNDLEGLICFQGHTHSVETYLMKLYFNFYTKFTSYSFEM